MMARALLLALAFSMLHTPRAEALLCHVILGCSCTVTATDVSFGSFTPLAAAPQYATGEVTIDCTGVIDLAPAVAVKLDDGQWGTFAARKLRASSGALIDYNIYTSAAYGTIWGDGTGGTSGAVVSGGLLALGHWTASRTMFARAAPTATTQPGAYADLIVVRIDW